MKFPPWKFITRCTPIFSKFLLEVDEVKTRALRPEIVSRSFLRAPLIAYMINICARIKIVYYFYLKNNYVFSSIFFLEIWKDIEINFAFKNRVVRFLR